MSEAKHTPGPWFTRSDDCPMYVRAPGGGSVAHVDKAYHTSVDKNVGLANARLIAAAPDLLAECEKLCNELDTLTGGDPSHPQAELIRFWQRGLRAAITKATTGGI